MNLRSRMLGVAFIFTSLQAAAQADSVAIAVPGNAPVITSNTLGTTPTTLQLSAAVYPLTLGQGVTWSVIPGNTATGTINTAGLLSVPAQTSGYIWLKATSVDDPSEFDSVQVLVYCKPSHTNPLNWFNIDTVRIPNTTLNSGTVTVGNPGAYVTFPATGNTTASLTTGSTYALYTQVTSPPGQFAPDPALYTYSVSAWIDYNRNGIFEASEYIQVEDSAASAYSQQNFTVPGNAAPGYAMMRVRVRLYGSSNGIADMCLGYTGSGQTEDYIISIAEQPTCAGDPGPNPGDLGCVSFIYNGSTVIYPTVRGEDGNIWLQKNLGATQIATAQADIDAYGDLFQWGRWADGHQFRNSAISTTAPMPNNPSGLGNGVNTFFTTSPAWWNVQALTDTWNAPTPGDVTDVNGCDPCKQLGNGWHLPSVLDWQTIVAAESITSPNLAFTSNLKLATGGVRNSSGNFDFVGTRGYYWTNEPASTGGKYFYYSSAIINPSAGGPRAQAAAIRCVRSNYVDSVAINTQGNIAPQITTNAGTLQMESTVYPLTTSQDVTWSIVPGTGNASISTAGLVTAINNGTVWAKAVSAADITKSDSLEITITSQVVAIDSVVVATVGNVPAEITTNAGMLPLESTVYPLNADQSVTWYMIPVSGSATINTSGVVTAQANGTVWAKAVSVVDISKSDSILITISNQTIPVDSVTVNTLGNIPAEITSLQGILQLESTVHPLTTSQDVQWSVVPVSGNATISTAGNVTAVADGTVWAKAVSVQDVSKSDSILITISNQTLSVQALSEGSIKVYPNPASSFITIELPTSNSEAVIQVTNVSGAIMDTEKIKNTNKYTLDVSKYAAGVYILNVQGDTAQKIRLNIIK